MRFKISYLLFAVVSMACSDSKDSAFEPSPKTDEEKINEAIASVEPVFALLRSRSTEEDDPYLIEFDLAKDQATGEIAVLNFRTAGFFPIDTYENLSRMARDTYVVECNKDGKITTNECNTVYSCANAIKACIDGGGCATICQKPTKADVYIDDINFFNNLGVSTKDLKALIDRPKLNIEKATRNGTLTSVKLTSLIL